MHVYWGNGGISILQQTSTFGRRCRDFIGSKDMFLYILPPPQKNKKTPTRCLIPRIVFVAWARKSQLYLEDKRRNSTGVSSVFGGVSFFGTSKLVEMSCYSSLFVPSQLSLAF